MMMNGKCADRPCARRHQQHQQQRTTPSFKSVVRRVLVALSFRLGRHGAVTPPRPPAAAAAEGGDEASDGLVLDSEFI